MTRYNTVASKLLKNMLSGGSSATFRAYDADTQSVLQNNKKNISECKFNQGLLSPALVTVVAHMDSWFVNGLKRILGYNSENYN